MRTFPSIAAAISHYESERRDADRDLTRAQAALKRHGEDLERRGVTSPEGQDRAALDSMLRSRDDAKDRAAEARGAIARLHEEQADEDQYARRTRETTPGAAPAVTRESRARVGSEARTYRPDTDPTGTGFLADVARGFMFNDPQANARLARHMDEERVERPQYLERADTVTTGNMVGLTVPQYLTDQYAPATAALRPLLDHANTHPLPPDGLTLNISRITTPTTAAIQSPELSAVSGTGADDTLLPIAVQTFAGENTVSRQALERGTGVEDLVLQDLFRRCATVFDSTVINQASTGLLAVGQTTTYTDASPTPQLLWPSFAKAQSLLEQALLGVAVPDYIVMHPRRWNWFTSVLGSTWPLLGQPNVQAQSGGIVLTNEYGSGVRGVLPNGLRVIVDANLPVNLGAGTNQDPILVIASEEINVWEDANAPLFIRAEQPQAANLGVLIVVYQYGAYTASRYANNPGIINGTGVIAPAGF